MKRILVIIHVEYLSFARSLLVQEPFNQTPEQAASSFIRADQGGTRYWLSAQVSDAAFAACKQLTEQLPWALCYVYNLDTQPGFPQQWLEQNGLQPFTPEMTP